MSVIALTGGIACGKTTVCAMLQKLGAFVVDADAISRSLTAPGGKGLPLIRDLFGDGVFLPDGTLDRRALGSVVFSDETQREKLNAALHPLIRSEMAAQILLGRKQGARIVLLDVPLLFEAGMQDMADVVVCVHVPPDVQLERLIRRDGFTREEALLRIQSQWPLTEKMRLSDECISTHKPIDQLQSDVTALYRRWERNAHV